MTEAATWRDVKVKARAADPMWDSTERVARRREMHEQMLASVSGAQSAEIRERLESPQQQRS
ncbi:hypothetical protein ACQEVZ_24910 [Dactylosporangium sp. CA-152071]|uniref:hypothetical protein n=1 Tax=Dactylosporangium sp. CA-152071 TaxID=3239933 RepID=UPI003D8B77F3